MAIIEVIKYDGAPDMLVWKYPNQQLGTWTQLIVNESQEALLFKGGEALDLFGAGRHTLSTQNIPVLSALVNLPFGGKSPFTAEVWFVNKLRKLDIKWGTSSPIQLQEPKYQMLVSVRAFGQFGIQVTDTRKFVHKLVGTLGEFDQGSLSKYFKGILLMNIKEFISTYLVRKKISILEMNAYLTDISRQLEERVAPVFEEYGLRLIHFSIESINLPEHDPATVRLKEALAKKAEMNILGYTYQQERTFNTLESAAKNEGGRSAFMDAGIGLGMGQSVGHSVGNKLSRMVDELDGLDEEELTCPKCRTSNESDANFCIECGCALSTPEPENDPSAACGQCGAVLQEGSKFCQECGASVALTCKKCHQSVQPGQKFCFECGNKLS